MFCGLSGTAHGCGLVTLTDAQRLCCALLGSQRAVTPSPNPPVLVDDVTIPVMHRCFGKCAGSLRPSTRVVRCVDCGHELDAQQFVAHSHGDQERHTCHWGFDPSNWRAYLQLAAPANVSEDDERRLRNCLDYFKEHADDELTTTALHAGCRKRRQVQYPHIVAPDTENYTSK